MKTRTITRTRTVPHTVDGDTEWIDEEYTVDIPLPPVDWDQRVRVAVTIGAVVLVTASLVWTTASVGALLAMSTVAFVAYAAGVAFDATWILCMGAEWLLRYDPERAKLPRKAGHWALGISMAAVFAHGYVFDQLVVGAVGAAVSALAKGGWTIAMRVHARPLDSRTQQWVTKRRSTIAGQRAMVAVRRELQRDLAAIEAERIALDPSGSADPDQSGQDEDESPEPPAVGPMTVKDAVRTAKDSGITDPDTVLRYVRKVADANAKLSTVERYLRLAS
ncbi:protein transporter Sec31 [Streptomyces sp. DSM 40750]|uniref:protein transporter Sec31 n=1 Tax=Streptomyces sp. DSM 40750 TaxID=2801030 RepID=UPI00214AFEAD|nr:protein transporter Sec31 [Streptomyces sp. DSM 40750]UUU21700.1 protein transporter Sec31 [Streptomyces sp. DSM 40750]